MKTYICHGCEIRCAICFNGFGVPLKCAFYDSRVAKWFEEK